MIGLSAIAALLPLRASAATNHAVTIQGMKFNPAEVNAKVGDTITVTNMDGAPHTLSAEDGSFDSGKLTKGQSADIALPAPGDFAFHCKIHLNMKGVIHVS